MFSGLKLMSVSPSRSMSYRISTWAQTGSFRVTSPKSITGMGMKPDSGTNWLPTWKTFSRWMSVSDCCRSPSAFHCPLTSCHSA